MAERHWTGKSSNAHSVTDVSDVVFAGDGEMRAKCREMNWATTPLGPVEDWPEALRTIVRTALESPFPINLWCGGDLVLIYNDAYRPVLGSKHPAALGRPGAEVWAEIWPAIGPLFEQIKGGGPPVFAEDAQFVTQRTTDRGEGADTWFTFALSPVRDDAGNIIAFFNVVAETTGQVLAERRLNAAREAAERAEGRLREVFLQAPAFMAVLRGRDHVFEFANEAYVQLIGRRDILGKPVKQALPEVTGQGFVDLLDNVLARGRPFIGREIPVKLARSPGAPIEQRYLNFVYQPLRESAEGTPVGIVAHGSDVTEQVVARQQVEAAREAAESARREAEEANLAKSQFLATMSHELRTPLNAIGGYADLLLMGVRGELNLGQREDVERLKRSAQHLLGLINDVLNFAKLEAGQVEFNIGTVALGELLDGLEDLIRPQLAAKSLRYHQKASDPGLLLRGDAEKVRQIMLNLLANAVKFTDSGGRIGVWTDADDRAVRIHVSDSGRGIAPEQLARVFDAFVQVDRHLTPASQQGVGLGLAISRDLAVGMGGSLAAESVVGQGSTFTLTLPRA
jgi:signal transduction histidine kinase